MEQNNLDFSFDMSGVDRAALMKDAANQMDLLFAHLGPDAQVQKSNEGDKIRDLADEDAWLAEFPEIYRITESDFPVVNNAVPIAYTELSRSHNYYWLKIPIGLKPKRNWAFNMIEVAIEFNPDESLGHLRPKAYQIFPHKKFQTYLEAHQYLKIGLDENFNLMLKPDELKTDLGKLEIGTGVVFSGGAGITLGEFNYQVKRPKIYTTDQGLSRVFWRVDGAEFFQEDILELVVIAQVPKETKSVNLTAQLQAYRNFNFAAAELKQLVEELPKMVRNFFKGGLPLPDEKQWDLTPRL